MSRLMERESVVIFIKACRRQFRLVVMKEMSNRAQYLSAERSQSAAIVLCSVQVVPSGTRQRLAATNYVSRPHDETVILNIECWVSLMHGANRGVPMETL